MPPNPPRTKRKCFNGVFILAILPVALFRFVVFAPFGFYWARATTHWDIIEHHAELSKGLYDPAIAAGEKIASEWGTLAFYWNFAVWIPSLWCPPPLNLPFMIMDILITINLSKATHHQTGYAPHSEKACGGPTGAAHTWHRPAGANESFFEAAGRLNATVATPVNMCRSFVEEWQLGVALSFFYALIAAINTIAFCGALLGAKKRDESFRDLIVRLLKKTLEHAWNAPKGFAIIIAGILYFLPQFIFRCLPLSFKSKVRYGRRYTVKTGLGLEQKAEMEVMELRNRHKQSKREGYTRYQGGGGEQSPLSNFLGIYDMSVSLSTKRVLVSECR